MFVSTRELKDRDHNHCSQMIVGLGTSLWPRGKYIRVWETQTVGDSECAKKLWDCILLHHHFLCHENLNRACTITSCSHTQTQQPSIYCKHITTKLYPSRLSVMLVSCLKLKWVKLYRHWIDHVSAERVHNRVIRMVSCSFYRIS